MGALNVRVRDAGRNPLDDRIDFDVIHLPTNRTVRSRRGISGKTQIRLTELVVGELYRVRVFPSRYRPTGRFVSGPGTRNLDLELCCPVHPQRVREAAFPEYPDVDVKLSAVLERSDVEDAPAPAAELTGTPGAALYGWLGPLEKAGLFNIFFKMSAVALHDQMTAWSFVESLYRIRGDRIFANVQIAFRDHVKTAVHAGLFTEVSGALHTPPPGFVMADSFKTREPFGNLQLTFFASVDSPLRFKVDADIDDAQGLAHAFQVLEHWLTDGETHPYDIHQILTIYHGLGPGYELLV